MSKTTNLLWLDIETTGQDHPDEGQIIEVAAIVTRGDLSRVPPIVDTASLSVFGIDPSDLPSDTSQTWTIKPTRAGMIGMPAEVIEMHLANDLLHEAYQWGATLEDVEGYLIDFIDPFLVGGRITLAGSGVAHYDRPWLNIHMPDLVKRLNYFSLDIGTTRRLIRAVAPELLRGAPKPEDKTHRALDDIEQHLAEARFYKDVLRDASLALQPIPIVDDFAP